MKYTILSLTIIWNLILPFQTFAGGSFQFDTELEPILNQKPELKKFIMETFDLADSGYTPNRIGQQVNSKFGGRRLGPYHLKAKPKGQKGDYIFELIFHTKPIFLDKEGHLTELSAAETIKEKLTSIEIKWIE